MRSLFLIAALFLVCVQSATADDKNNPYGFPDEWFSCTHSDDCGKVTSGCHGVVASVNTNYVEKAKAAVFKKEPTNFMFCSRIPADDTIAECHEGRCSLYSPKP